mmetsp:Transcript_87084/g.150254  ORF Transcript_87084/g.150254 Transcript_87084/m.150254 type:complete len:350 (+) Transcript_87084:1-1050(+)
MQNQENRPPVQPQVKEVVIGSPRTSPGASFPVKNTFIHYGTPLRTSTAGLSTPKTVPPDFAPEALAACAPWPFSQPSQSPQGPLSPLPNTGGRPGPENRRPNAVGMQAPAVVGAADAGATGQRGGVAPLRLFDFLPSPTVQPLQPPQQLPTLQPAPLQAPMLQMQAQPPQPMPTMQHPSLQAAPPPPTYTQGAGAALPNTAAQQSLPIQVPLWQRLDSVSNTSQVPTMQPPTGVAAFAPMPFPPAEGLQAIAWPPWQNGGDMSFLGAPPPNPCQGSAPAPMGTAPASMASPCAGTAPGTTVCAMGGSSVCSAMPAMVQGSPWQSGAAALPPQSQLAAAGALPQPAPQKQ